MVSLLPQYGQLTRALGPAPELEVGLVGLLAICEVGFDDPRVWRVGAVDGAAGAGRA